MDNNKMNYYLVRLTDYLGDHSAEINELVVSDKPLSYKEIEDKCKVDKTRTILHIELLKEVKDETEN